MSPIRRLSSVGLAVLLLIGARAVMMGRGDVYEPSTSFVQSILPQRALGDFDGDGRIDTALIQDRAGDRRISIQLSRTASAVGLDTPVAGVIESDVDHDGDLDLIAATPSGDVLLWLNDGHGVFTRLAASTRDDNPSAVPLVVSTESPEFLAVGSRAPVVLSPLYTHAIALTTKAQPPSVRVALEFRAPIFLAVRAPPARSL